MSSLTFGQLEDEWTSQGGPAAWAPLAAGIALAESSGDPTAANTSDPYGGSYGLWQINGSHDPSGYADPTWVAQMEQPANNAAEAVALSGGGTDWQPWQQDRLWDQWVSAGRPAQPSADTVQGWLSAAGVTTGGSTATTGTAPGGSSSSGALGAAAINPNAFDLLGIPQALAGSAAKSAAGAVWSEVGPFLVKAILVIAGLAIMVLGVYQLAGSPKAPNVPIPPVVPV